MPNLIDELLPYVPDLVISQISKSNNFPKKPTTESFKAAALFADISGFTSITEQLVARGPQGVEMLSRILNDYFGKLTSQIADHGGDVVNFAGDSLLGIWKLEDDEQPMRQIELRQSAEIFNSLGAKYDLGKTIGLLDNKLSS